jgi:adenine-specific DNA methylase
MNFKINEREQKLRGGYYTEPLITDFLIRWVKAIKPKSILEPSCGDGAFLESIQRMKVPSAKRIVGVELDPAEAAKAKARTKLKVEIVNGDFLRWAANFDFNQPFDAVVGNPPFIRYQYLAQEQQAVAEHIFRELGLPFTAHTNAWVPFVLCSLNLLRPGGRLAMVLPSELLHLPHSQALRCYLAEHCSRIFLLDPEEIWFEGTLQGTVLLLAEKKESPNQKGLGVCIRTVVDRSILSSDPETYFQEATYTNGETIQGKWMSVFLSKAENSVLADLREHKSIKIFNDLAKVDVGIVTGANSFFLVSDTVVKDFCLERYAHPMFGRSNHVDGLIYDSRNHEANKRKGLPTNFLWFREEDYKKLPASVQTYLKMGLEMGLHKRFKCRVRKCWYKVPSVYAAPVAMLKRAHHYPRLILNSLMAYTTDTAYRILPKEGTNVSALVLGFVNSLTALSAEMEGRSYGGGVLELVPSEIERLLVPVINAKNEDLRQADKRFRESDDKTEFLRVQNAAILGSIGVSKKDQDTIHGAFIKLRDRRQRVSSLTQDMAN